MKKQNRKLLCLLVSFVVLSTCLLFSCGEGVGNASSDAESSSRSDASSAGELNEQENQSSEESSEESHGESSEPDYQVQMNEEMINAFFKLKNYNETVKEYMTENGLTDEWLKSTYVAYGRLGEYILCNMPSFAANTAVWSTAAGEYLFTSYYTWSPSYIGLYLYKDGDLIPFEDADGLFDPEDAYELILNYSGPEPTNKITVKKLSELSDEYAEYYRGHQYGKIYD